MKIIYLSPAAEYVCDDLQASRCASVEELLTQADFVSLHCPGNANTRHLINANTLKSMLPTAHLINTARDDVVDTQALIESLKNQQIAGAGLDVFEGEPDDLLALDNVSLLPHLGSATLPTRAAMGEKALSNLAAFFAGTPLPDQVI